MLAYPDDLRETNIRSTRMFLIVQKIWQSKLIPYLTIEGPRNSLLPSRVPCKLQLQLHRQHTIKA